MRGSVIRLVSNFAGAIMLWLVWGVAGEIDSIQVDGWMQLTSLGYPTVVTGEVVLAATAWGEERCAGGSPQVVRGI